MKLKTRKETDFTENQCKELKDMAEELGMTERSLLRMAFVWFHKFHKLLNKFIE